MIKSLSALCLSVAFLFSLGNCQEHGKFALNSQINPFTIADMFSSFMGSAPSYEPSCKIGFRYSPIELLGIDVNYGMLFNSGNKRDSANQTAESPSYHNFKFDLGAAYTVATGEHAALAVMAQYGMSFQQWYDSYLASSATSYVYYGVFQPSLFFGLEPSFFLSKNIALFSVFGLHMVFVPDSKTIDMTDPSFNPATKTFPLRKVHDSKVSMVTNGCSIGIRYYF
jgi:hypothetical protein